MTAASIAHEGTSPASEAGARHLDVADPSPADPLVVYFSSVTENPRRFVDKLGRRSARIPLRPADPFLTVDEDYVLVTPTYGGGTTKGAVPKQVIKFLNHEGNRAHIRAVVSAGNTNFGAAYCIAGDIIAAKCHVPHLYKFELLGMPDDITELNHRMEKVFA